MIKTISKIGYAMRDESSPGAIAFKPIVWLESKKAGGREITSEPVGSLQSVDADGINVFDININGGYNHQLTLLSILDSVDKDWLHKRILSDGTVVEVADNKPAPRFALLVANETINDDHLYNIEVYPNTTADRYTKSSKSNPPGEEIDFEFPQYSLNSRPMETNKISSFTLKCDELPETLSMPDISDDSSGSSTDNSSASTDNSDSDGE